MCSNNSEVVKLTQELVKIPSENPVGTEETISDFIFNWFKELNLDVTREEVEPGRYNIVAKLLGNDKEPNLLYIAHMDTVSAGEGWTYGPFSAKIVNGKLYGRGSADMKGGVAAAMVAFKRIALRKEKPKRSFIFIASVDEEGIEMKGALAAIDRGWAKKSSYVIATEPTRLAVMLAHKGVLWYEIISHGKASHAGNPQLGVDANHAMAEILSALKKIVNELPYNDNLVGKPTVSIGKISGGVKTNIVSSECRAEIDLRIVVPMTIAKSKQIIEKAVNEGIKNVPGASATFRLFNNERPPIKAAEDSPLVAAVAESVKKVTNKDPEFKGLPGYTDASIIGARTGCPHCISFGPANMAQAHSIDEYAPIEQLNLAADILTETALKLIY